MSTRAMAQSAIAAGFQVSSVDAFGDLDHPQSVGVFTPGVGARWRTHCLPALAAASAPDARTVAYGSSLENDPRAVAALTRGRALWGNPPDVLRRVRDPRLLRDALRSRGEHPPDVCMPGDTRPFERPDGWLLKPRRSGGGHDVRAWRRGTRVPQSRYAQRYLEGVPGSVLFVAARDRVAPLGITRQLVGDEAFGACGFRYCGSILCAANDDGGWAAASVRLTHAVSSAFDLVGVGGVDFIARDGLVHPIEVNPRWTSSMELVERVWGRSLFGAHASACVDGHLPAVDASGFVTSPARAHGKAIVFATRNVRLGDTRVWLDAGVADVPHPETQVAAGRPVCTVFAEGPDAPACREALVARAADIYRQLDEWNEEAA